MPAPEDEDYYNLYWTAASTYSGGQLINQPGFDGNFAAQVDGGGRSGSGSGWGQETEHASASDSRYHDPPSSDRQQQDPSAWSSINALTDEQLPRSKNSSYAFDETGHQRQDVTATWSHSNGTSAGPNSNGAPYYRDDSYRPHDERPWQNENGSINDRQSEEQWTPIVRMKPTSEGEPTYAKIGSNMAASYASYDCAPNYENVPDAGPVRGRDLERRVQGGGGRGEGAGGRGGEGGGRRDVSSHGNGRALPPAYAPRPGLGIDSSRPSRRLELDCAVRPPSRSQHDASSAASFSGEDDGTAHRRPAAAAVAAMNWQQPSRVQPRGGASGRTAATPDQLGAAGGGSSYRTAESTEQDIQERWPMQRPSAVDSVHAAPVRADYAQLPASSWSRPRADQAPDSFSVTTGGSDLFGPPGYGQLFEAAYLSSRMQAGQGLTGSKGSLDSQSQDAAWHSPDLSEVIDLLSQGSIRVLRNAAAYLQHLCFNNNSTKAKARSLGGIRVLAGLLHTCDAVEVQRVVCGCLLNLTRGRENDEGKRELRDCGGIEAMARLLRKSADNDVRELATGIFWNLSSCKVLKRSIIDAALTVLVNTVVIPHSGWDPRRPSDDERPLDVYWSTVFRNASGALRNVSSDGHYARKKLRECAGLIESLLCITKAAIGKNDIDNKSVENCVCILRNLSYRLMEIDYPDYYDSEAELSRRSTPSLSSPSPSVLSGCLKGSAKKKSQASANKSKYPCRTPAGSGRGELLWQPDVVYIYLPLLADCSNPDTLEAAIGALQNLTACEWQPAVDLREKIRREKGLPIVVELLGLEADNVVYAAAIALRNLAMDTRNKELIGKYAIQPLLSKLPPRAASIREQRFSEQTVCAVIATLHEIIKDSVEHASTIVTEGDGVARLMTMARSQSKYEARTLAHVRQLLAALWRFAVLRPIYKKKGWKEADFMAKAMYPRPSSASQSSLPSGVQSRPPSRADDVTTTRSDTWSRVDVPIGPSRTSRRSDVPSGRVPPAVAMDTWTYEERGGRPSAAIDSTALVHNAAFVQANDGGGGGGPWSTYQTIDDVHSGLQPTTDRLQAASAALRRDQEPRHEALNDWASQAATSQASAGAEPSREPLYAKVDRRWHSAAPAQPPDISDRYADRSHTGYTPDLAPHRRSPYEGSVNHHVALTRDSGSKVAAADSWV